MKTFVIGTTLFMLSTLNASACDLQKLRAQVLAEMNHSFPVQTEDGKFIGMNATTDVKVGDKLLLSDGGAYLLATGTTTFAEIGKTPESYSVATLTPIDLNRCETSKTEGEIGSSVSPVK